MADQREEDLSAEELKALRAERKALRKKEREEAQVGRSARIEGRCALFIPRKQRYCRMIAHPGHDYCFEHFMHETKIESRKRVVCPFNPNHTAFEDQIKAHIEKCPSKAVPKPDYYQESINRPKSINHEGLDDNTMASENQDHHISISTLSADELRNFVTKIHSLAAVHLPTVEERVSSHPVVEAEIARTAEQGKSQIENGGTFKLGRHLQQQSSLIGHLHDSGFLQPQKCFIEFGAGKAKYLHWISKALGTSTPATYIAVDRSNSRNKFDKFLTKVDEGVRFERLLIDIEHLVLSKAPGIKDGTCGSIIACSKHLCGVATDLTLTCLSNFNPSEEEPLGKRSKNDSEKENLREQIHHNNVHGISIALCCHQVCDYSKYCNPKFISETLGLSPREFKLLTSMSSWAVCGTRLTKSKAVVGEQEDDDEEENENPTTEEQYVSTTEKSGLSRGEQEELGWICKRLIDAGRIQFLKQLGFDAKLIKYVSKDITLENILLHAVRKM